MVFIDNYSEELAVHWWSNSDSSFKFNIIIPNLACLVPVSFIMWIEVNTIIGCLERDSINLSVLVAAAAISSSHQRHF
jgi:hypothetical protein